MIDRQQYDVWEAAGAKDMGARANQRAKTLLAEHKVPNLTDEAEAVINDILEERKAERAR